MGRPALEEVGFVSTSLGRVSFLMKWGAHNMYLIRVTVRTEAGSRRHAGAKERGEGRRATAWLATVADSRGFDGDGVAGHGRRGRKWSGPTADPGHPRIARHIWVAWRWRANRGSTDGPPVRGQPRIRAIHRLPASCKIHCNFAYSNHTITNLSYSPTTKAAFG